MIPISSNAVQVHSIDPMRTQAWLLDHNCVALTDPQRVALAPDGRRLHESEYLAAEVTAMANGGTLLTVIAEATCCDDAPRLGSYIVMHV